MRRYGYHPDEYDLEQQRELARREERDDEREPRRMNDRPRLMKRRRRYFSGLLFRPVVANDNDGSDDRERS